MNSVSIKNERVSTFLLMEVYLRYYIHVFLMYVIDSGIE